MSKTIQEVMETLISLGSESRRKTNIKNGAGENQFGVLMGPMRKLAAEIGIDHDLAMKLWETGNTDAMMLSCMVMAAAQLSPDQAEAMIMPLTYTMLIDELSFTALPLAPWAVDKMQVWMNSSHPILGRVGWNLLINQMMQKKKLPFTIDNLLAWIEKETKDAPEPKQWVMNRCLCEIGIRMREYTDRCVAIGEKLGRLDNRPVPKGCYSSYAPEWIAAGIRLADQRKRR